MSTAKVVGQWLIETTDELTMGELQDWLDQFPTSAASIPLGSIRCVDDYLEVDLNDSPHVIFRGADAPDPHRNVSFDL